MKLEVAALTEDCAVSTLYMLFVKSKNNLQALAASKWWNIVNTTVEQLLNLKGSSMLMFKGYNRHKHMSLPYIGVDVKRYVHQMALFPNKLLPRSISS